MKICYMLLVLMTALTLAAAETLNLKFDQPQNITLGNATVAIDGEFTPDGFLAYGENGISLPAAGLVGEAGTVLFKFKMSEFKEPVLVPRYLLTLRTNSRLMLGFYTFTNSPLLHFNFTDMTNKYYFKTEKNLVPGQIYQAAFTWDGTTVRVYLDGLLMAEAKQPVAVEKVSKLNIGPYKDGWIAPKPWGNDCFIGELKTWNHALTSDEILAASGIKPKLLSDNYPLQLTVPRLTAAPPVLDGELNDPAWQNASGMIGLIHGKEFNKSWDLPPHSFKLMYDKDNLYLGFDTLFPGRVPIKAGAPRGDSEPEVWGDESFELYLQVNDVLYRFGGNVAGGFTEWRGTDSAWNGSWTYKTSLKMRIDDCQLWQGEVAIPWTTLGLNAPPATPVKFNFCRTWRLPETGTHSSTSEDGSYAKVERFPELRFADTAPALQVLAQNNPDSGKFEQKIQLASARNGKVDYRLQLAKADGSAAPLTVLNKSYTLTSGKPATDDIVVPLTQTGYDRMIFSLSQGKELLMQEIMPFQLNEEYVLVSPQFLKEKIYLTVKQDMLKGKFGPDFAARVRITGPAGQAIYNEAIKSADETPVTFVRANPAGPYKIELLNSGSSEVVFSRVLNYPGIGEWEKLSFDNRIIAPFTALKVDSSTAALNVNMWGRNYQWHDQLFPTQITTQNQPLLSAPVTLEIGGKPVAKAQLKPGTSADHRAELTATARNSDYQVNSESWIEYDGIQWNQVKIQALNNLQDIKIKIEIPAALVKYLHTSDGFAWGTKLTEAVNEGTRAFRFYPVVWLGMEDKGLCFFAESRATWTSPANQTYRIIKNNATVVLEVNLAAGLKKGEEFAFDFGLLATPVKPLPKNYPLNTFSYHFAAPLNRPGQIPTSDVMLADAGGELGAFFGDLPTPENCINGKYMTESIRKSQEFGGRAVPYACDRYLSDEYPEVAAFADEWKISPDQTLDYMRDGRKFFLYDCCPTTGANAFYMYKFKQMLERYKPNGIYFDFGIVPVCSNTKHGCNQRTPLLAQREFYRRILLTQLDAGIKEPVIVLHNTDSIQLPATTFVTHLFNGEHIRQASSTLLHNGKDILDNYDLPMWASELNSLPFGLTNSVYLPVDNLMPQYGGGKETESLYKFRQTKAGMAATLIHNTMPALLRCHFGIYDKLIRFYHEFNVPEAKFHGYWQKPAVVKKGQNVFVSVYRHAGEPRILAVIGHVSKSHEDQELEIEFDSAMLGVGPLNNAIDKMTAPDPAYADLEKRLKEHNVLLNRTPLELGDFGSEIISINNNVLKMKLKHHSFAIIELSR